MYEGVEKKGKKVAFKTMT